jgi:hypothetical protein
MARASSAVHACRLPAWSANHDLFLPLLLRSLSDTLQRSQRGPTAKVIEFIGLNMQYVDRRVSCSKDGPSKSEQLYSFHPQQPAVAALSMVCCETQVPDETLSLCLSLPSCCVCYVAACCRKWVASVLATC